MKLTVLGKYGPYTKAGNSATSCYLVEDGDTKLLMDMGSGALAHLQQYMDVRDIDAIYLTHLHFDHTSDLLTFRYLLEDLHHRVTIYAPFEDSEWYRVLLNHPLFDVVNYGEDSDLRIGSLTVRPFRTKHPVPNYAAKVIGSKTLVYTGDTLFFDSLIDRLKGVDLVVMDCSKPSGFTGPHMTVDNAEDIQRRTGAKILSSHANPDYVPTFANPNIAFAEEMKTYEV